MQVFSIKKLSTVNALYAILFLMTIKLAMKKRIFIVLFTVFMLASASTQVSVMPTDPIYTDISNWENLGIINNVPPLRPYPLTLISSFLETVMKSEYTDQAAKALSHYERIFGKTLDVGFEVADSFKYGNTSVDATGKNGDSGKVNELDVLPTVRGDVKVTDNISLGINANLLVTNGYDKNPLPTFERKSYDAVNDTTDLKFAQMFLDMNATVGIGNENMYFQAGISRNSFGPFYEDSVALNPSSFHTGNMSFVVRHNNWNFTQAMFILGATNDLGGGLAPNKFMMMHSIQFSPLNWLTLSYYENVIYGGRFDPIYLLPVPYMVAQGIGSFGDNVQMGVTMQIRPKTGLAWNTDIFIDDLAASDFAKLRFDTKFRFGAMTGLVYTPLDSSFTEISANYTLITPYMYTHEQFDDDGNVVGDTAPNYQNYTNNGMSLGSNLPPNSDRIAFKIKANPVNGLNLTIAASMIRHSNINELLYEKAPEEMRKYLSASAPTLLTNGGVLNHPYSVGAYDYAWNHFMFLQSATKMFIWKASIDAEYTLPWKKLGTMSLGAGYTFEYIKNNGVQRNMFEKGLYTPEQMDQAFTDWKSALHDDVNHYFRFSFKYLFGI